MTEEVVNTGNGVVFRATKPVSPSVRRYVIVTRAFPYPAAVTEKTQIYFDVNPVNSLPIPSIPVQNEAVTKAHGLQSINQA